MFSDNSAGVDSCSCNEVSVFISLSRVVCVVN